MNKPVGFGVVGGRANIANKAVLSAIADAAGSYLVAIAARSGPVEGRWAHAEVGNYDDVINHPEVHVVYIPLANDKHRAVAEQAAQAGKHILCEKPLAPTLADASAMAKAAERAGVLLVEAWMTPFGPRWQEVIGLAASGAIGDISSIETEFSSMFDRSSDNYRWDAAKGGGALLDVGIYATGPAVAICGLKPKSMSVSSDVENGIDLTTEIELGFAATTFRGIVSFERPLAQTIKIVGTDGSLLIADEAHTAFSGPNTYTIASSNGDAEERKVAWADPYRLMIEAMSAAVNETKAWPRPIEETLAHLRLLEEIAAHRGVKP